MRYLIISTGLLIVLIAAFRLLSKKLDKDYKGFDEAIGVGIVITPEQIKAAVAEAIAEKKDLLVKKRYSVPIGSILGW